MKTNVRTNPGNNLPPVDVEDNTTTQGTSKRGGDSSTVMEKVLNKNEVFAKLKKYFMPATCIFDDSKIKEGMQPLVDSGVLPEAAMTVAIEKAKKEFEEANKETLQAAENIGFSEFLEKLQANRQLYNETCKVCNVSEITEKMVFNDENRIVIYRGSQSEDKEGKSRYMEGAVARTSINVKTFSEKIFYEIKDNCCVSNYIAAIRYYSFYSESLKKVIKSCKDSEKTLSYAIESVKKALSEGFSIEDITRALSAL